MIFSVWRPDGGYDYYESSKRHGLGDDLPDVRMPPSVSAHLGVPAQDVGRSIPSGAVYIGRGDVPQGVMAPMSRPSIGIGEFKREDVPNYLLVGLVVGIVGFILGKRS